MLNLVYHKINENYNKVEFYRVNKELCNNKAYKELSPCAILLYSLLCDRLSLAYSNLNNNKISKIKNYCDEDENMYVIFTRIGLQEKLHVGRSAISSAFKQLKNANLIKEKVQGRNRPNKIYVGKTIAEISGEFIKATSENQHSGDTNSSTPDSRKSDANKNNILNNKNKNGFSNYQSRDYSDYDLDSLYANKF
ncbi:MAG: replication initiator protein A [Clostridia bacterium]